MQFNSYIFILLFLPLFIMLYFILNRIHRNSGKILIILSGTIFYLYAGIDTALILGTSIVFNFIFSKLIKRSKSCKKFLFAFGIAANILLLLYYKYSLFVVSTINEVFGKSFTLNKIILPLGISFFTFQQIMFLVSVYKNEIEEVYAVDYLAYILFFPKLIMGPLVEAKDFISQINNPSQKRFNIDNLSSGIKLFSLGLFQKMVLADTFSKAVSWGFSNIGSATSGDFFLVMLFYTFEIYFDFNGYSMMAVGVSKMININLPVNFNSPYKALSIKDFWKRWHISLTGFLTKYIYYPLGGSKKSKIRTYINIMIVFLVSGLWHGANWTFILWGFIHGIFQILERLFDKQLRKQHEGLKWVSTFLVVNLLWLLFRSESVSQWTALLGKMFVFSDMRISDGLIKCFVLPENNFILNMFHLNTLNTLVRGFPMLLFTVFSFFVCLVPEAATKTCENKSLCSILYCAVAFVWAFLCLSSESVFVYFNF